MMIFVILEYNVDTMSQGHVWVSSIQNVIQSLQDAVKLQKELQQEWNEEYHAVLTENIVNLSRKE